ncbi:DnaJ domain-containing protein [Roseomonas sp. OT10]|uniref:DnaJ C-terminal domain-containing protein n=1 Tax=Roseomonas cutis TaxID=2897332 RepID=UPI001E5A8569|nr:DnaJ C-terminal domain-containing protein [Roseomonas sp. OT10]UFN51232.1 DnaJ domain-containing protein [Roseomonas sp. OT10]
MAEDPYSILGVARTASAEEIRKAYRAIAKKNHPDLNPGNKEAEERFKAASVANDLLSDPEKRARYDRGEIDASGQERPERAYYRDFAEGPQGARYRRPGGGPGGHPGGFQQEGFTGAGGAGFGGSFDPEDLGDIFSDLFRGEGGGGGGSNRPRRGADRRYQMEVAFLDAVNGATSRLTLPSGETLDVRIPPGLEDGQVLRLRGKGQAGRNGGPDGDALIEVTVRAHPLYRREGRDLEMEVPVTVAEAVLGTRATLPTPRGEVAMTIPPGSDAGTRLRLRGRGVAEGGGQPAGDLFVVLKLVLGPVDDSLREFLRGWAAEHPSDPRQSLRDQA